MAKSPRAALTRIATTVTARNYPSSGAGAGFYLDGRISGRREQRSADTTLDREDRGFFFSVFASLSGNQSADAAQSRIRKSLDRIMNDVKQPGRNIDSEINDLAECAVNVAGRITLQHEGVSQPYFAGVIVRDSELAAVTMGGGCAFLYRGDILYPLTTDDYPLEAIDTQGKPISGLDVYCAGVAGTVRYSNIAQLQLDDCIIVCNKEIFEALGQREVLRLLYDAEDQADAAGLIVSAAAAKLPGIPMQFMIGFVESIMTADRTGRFSLNRAQSDFLATSQRLTAPFSPAAGKSDLTTPPSATKSARQNKRNEQHPVAGHQVHQPVPPPPPDEEADYEDEEAFADSFDSGSRGRKIAFYLIVALVCIGSLFAIYNMLFGGRNDNGETGQTTALLTTTTEPAETTTTTVPAADETSMTDDPDESTVETDDPDVTEPTTAEPTTTQAPTTTTATEAIVLPTEYTVVSGDYLGLIATRFYGSSDESYINLIREANGIPSDSEHLDIGQVLNIPARP